MDLSKEKIATKHCNNVIGLSITMLIKQSFYYKIFLKGKQTPMQYTVPSFTMMQLLMHNSPKLRMVVKVKIHLNFSTVHTVETASPNSGKESSFGQETRGGGKS